MDIAFLIIRIIVGAGLAGHGVQKLFGWFGGHGIAGTGGFFEDLGLRPGHVFALAAGLVEAGGGLLTFLGLGGPVGPALIVLVMVTAILSAHLGKGFFTTQGGPEMPLLYVAGALSVAFAGSGAYSLDRLFGIAFLTSATQVWFAIGAAIVIGILNSLIRRPAATPASTH
jgi:putative oxidoreductase